MALVAVKIVNNSDQTVERLVEEDGEELEYLRKLLRREDLKSVEVVKPSTRKPAAK
ncbi:hypothetical protein [Streptomyces cylindrosporus]|uniref:Uncharacterized protein n=1 Tax=Streptomyces cylindrosporus TaxID=2927583 RepID=A0ABS9Y1Y3_9ACTN|nr:hypothetical protein [Streptomyces cylindrosporus]MCI3271019.1 hypothetical protein [Streptomyces cylindrosporus]